MQEIRGLGKQIKPMETTESLEIVQSDALSTITRAETDVAIATARKFPRILANVKAKMIEFATLDEETASSCFYTLPRGGKSIQGPSVRLAEIALSSYQNIKAGARVLSVDSTSENPHVIVQAVCQDIQNNVSISIEKRRRITTKKNQDGSRKPVSDDDIQLAANAGSAIAFRDAVFKVIPGALIKPVYEQAKRVAVGEVKSIVERRGKVIDRLKQMGATEDRILAAVSCKKVDDVGLEQLEILVGLGTAIKDGEVTLEEAFPIVKDGPVRGTASEVKLPQQRKEEAPPAPVGTEPPSDTNTAPAPEPTPQVKLAQFLFDAGVTFDQLKSWAVGVKALKPFADLWTSVTDVSEQHANSIMEKLDVSDPNALKIKKSGGAQ